MQVVIFPVDLEKKEYPMFLQDRLPVPFETPEGVRIEDFVMRRLKVRERRELEATLRTAEKGADPNVQLLLFARQAYPKVLVRLGPLEPPIPREILEDMDTANEDYLVEAFFAIASGYGSVREYREANASEKFRTT